MRSRSCTVEGPDNGHIQPAEGFAKQDEEEEENKAELTRRRMKVLPEEKGGRTEKPRKPVEGKKLTKSDLLHLLGIMEGEVQAREDIIGLLKSDRTGPEALEARYASAAPTKPLQALQRDGLLGPKDRGAPHVYEKPMAELDRLQDKQKETYRRMLEQLLLAEKCHRRTVSELDNEKCKHGDFMNKSDDFTELLEQERERLKRLLEQEKAYQARKDKDHRRRLEKVRAELVKLKSFALMLVDERQLHIEQIHQQSQKVQDLAQKLQEKEQRLAALSDTAKEDVQKVLALEAELEHRAARFAQEHEEATAKLAAEESQSRQLRLKLVGLDQQIEELEESNKSLHKAEEDLQELRQKVSKGECGDSSLVTELENLRKRVLEMESKDEEITKTETQCRELRKKLQGEENHGKEMRLEVDRLQKRMSQLEKLERSFTGSKSECSRLHTDLEKEKRVVKDLAGELEGLKTRLKDFECSEAEFEKAEMVLKDDLMKLKSFTVLLVDERKNMAERLKQEEQKSDDLSRMFKAEQGKVTEVTEKLIEESKKLLKFKGEMEIRVTALVKEKDELKAKLVSEEEKCGQLNTKISSMRTRIDGLEETKREIQRKWSTEDNRRPDEDNKVGELTLEIERLKSRLKQLEVVEGDLMKTEDEYDLLEKRFRREQDRANAFSKQLEEMKSQIARNKAIEKGEDAGPEAQLRTRCKMEEARTRELQADVQALKEKIHELMNKEDQLSQLQADYSVLQQRFMREEEKKISMSHDFANLTKELEATKRYGRALRPSVSGKRMLDVPVTSTAVQTDVMAGEAAEDETAAGFIQKSVLEENHLMSNLRRGLKKPAVLERYPPATAELGVKKSWIPWMKKKEAITLTQTAPDKTAGASSFHPPESGQPLHIRVTPDHQNSTATLEITSPRAEDFFSSTTIIPTLSLQKPRITIVPKPASKAAGGGACEPAGGLDPVKSPVTITAISRAKTLDRTDRSPASVTAAEGHVKVTPERQPPPFRKYNGSIITTEDNKIHIHLGRQFKRPPEGCGEPPLTLETSVTLGESPTGTVRQPSAAMATQSKMSSSITITPVASPTSRPTSRPTQSAPGSEAHAARGAATRIPVSKGTKPSSRAETRFESRAESQSIKIELRRSTACGPASTAGGKG
ncbi:filamin-A-interacting protein 1-like isoform X1 [Pungitius pungitius]|uniref:filamin-A-interacting protein 1-like isoform X1 n=1 Tax=Pungitius pungitius TaxID=134920 RepID=UPI002E0FBA90